MDGRLRGGDAPDAPARAHAAEVRRSEMQGRPRQVVEELQAAKVLRAVYSERQLDEVLVDFWMNHFNVFAGKGPEKFLVGAYERDVIRPHAWGTFEDLLKATAESPAMLFYLDNWLSADPDAAAARDAMAPARRRLCGPARRGRRRHGARRRRRAASAASTRTTRARSWSCTRWAWTAATRRRT